MTWTLPHLTGIQRTTVGILNGLVAEGVPVRLTRFDRVRNRFEPLDAAHLPAGVRNHLSLAPATTGATGGARRRWNARERIFGTSPAAAELRTACRGFGEAARDLRRTFGRWLGVRIRESARWLPTPSRAGRTQPLPTRNSEPEGPFAAGDVLLSLGASWPIDGHAEAAAGMRRRGVRLRGTCRKHRHTVGNTQRKTSPAPTAGGDATDPHAVFHFEHGVGLNATHQLLLIQARQVGKQPN